VIKLSLLKRDCYTPDEMALLNATYDAQTRMLDDRVGELLEILGKRASLDDTLVIITADHGENLGDHHLMDHQWCVYDTLAHVPLIVRYPKRLTPGRTSDAVQTIDYLPTVMDAVHGRPVPTPSTFGRSLLTSGPSTTSPARGADSGPAGRVTVTERIAPADNPLATAQRIDSRFDRTPYLGVLRAVRQGPWKYIIAANGRKELYRVDNDPGEVDNLIASQRRVAEHLADRLGQWIADSRPYSPSSRQGGGRQLDTETRRRLRDLGYIH